MKTGTWYVYGFVVTFVYFYVYAVNYVRGSVINSYPPKHHYGGPLKTGPHRHPSAHVPQYSTVNGDPRQTNPVKRVTKVGDFADQQQPVYPRLSWQYHNYTSMTTFLRHVSTIYSNLTALYSIGQSVQGRELWVMVVSRSPYEHMIGKPNVKYVANMHGNEAVGRELMLHLILHLVHNYETDYYVRWLLDNTRIHIMPSMNPDGFEVSSEGTCQGGQGRYNARGFDLNRNFPDYFKQNNKRSQPETEAVKEWIAKIQFVLSGNIHGGALVSSYPFDNTPNSIFSSSISAPSLTPDDDVFKHLAQVYSLNHGRMFLGEPCKVGAPQFLNGTTNGAAWYPLTGGMQDYNYIWHGCMEITLELSCCKYPPSSELAKFWEDNRNSMLQFIGEAHRGVKGFVKDEAAVPIEGASMKIHSRDVGFQTTKEGEFWRVLLPGIYTIEVFAEGYQPREVQFAVIEQNPTLLNITLNGINRRADQLDRKEGAAAAPPSAIETTLGADESEQQSPSIFSSMQSSIKDFFSNLPGLG
jgi:carboxypeptidase M